MTRAWRQDLGRRSRGAGRTAEVLAAVWLMAKGYQILGFRLKASGAEIDILARRGRVLALVEVKRRGTLEAALDSLTAAQRDRLLKAGQALTARRRSLANLELRLDVFAFAPRRLPRHYRGLIVDGVR